MEDLSMTAQNQKKQLVGGARLAHLFKTGQIVKGSIFLVEYLKRQHHNSRYLLSSTQSAQAS